MAEQEEQVMAKQLLVALRSDDRIPKVMPSLEPVIQGGVRAKLSRFATILTACIGGRRRRPAIESYIPRKSSKEESRLEFQRFLYW
jgi:hypothetical protein